MSTEPISVVSTTVPSLPRMLDRRFVTAALMLVMVLASMEQTVTSTAMPTIIGELHGLEHYSWVASIYLLACTVSMPLYGRLADALGPRRDPWHDRAVFWHRCWRRPRTRWCSWSFSWDTGLGRRRDHAGCADHSRRCFHARRTRKIRDCSAPSGVVLRWRGRHGGVSR